VQAIRPRGLLGGVYRFRGDGEARSFAVAHGGVSAPRLVIVRPASVSADQAHTIVTTSELVLVVYTDPPPPGELDLRFEWEVGAE
jgi:hypothetical protein